MSVFPVHELAQTNFKVRWAGMKTKQCGRCGQEKGLDCFRFNDRKSKWTSYCKPCESEYAKDWYKKRTKTESGEMSIAPNKGKSKYLVQAESV